MAKSRKPQKSKEKEFKLSDYKLNQRDSVIFNLMQQYPELRKKEIAKMVGISDSQVSVIINKPAFKKALDDFSKSALEILRDAKVMASIKLRELIHHQNPRIAIRACENILRHELTPISFKVEDQDEEPDWSKMSVQQKKDYLAKFNAN